MEKLSLNEIVTELEYHANRLFRIIFNNYTDFDLFNEIMERFRYKDFIVEMNILHTHGNFFSCNANFGPLSNNSFLYLKYYVDISGLLMSKTQTYFSFFSDHFLNEDEYNLLSKYRMYSIRRIDNTTTIRLVKTIPLTHLIEISFEYNHELDFSIDGFRVITSDGIEEMK